MRAVLVLVACSACVETEPFHYDPPTQQRVEEMIYPLAGPAELDILFVIDDSPAMAPERDHLLASYVQLGNAMQSFDVALDLHIGVTTADAPVDRGALRSAASVNGNFLITSPHVELSTSNFSGELPATFTALAEVGTSGSTNMPLAAMEFALEGNPGFLRPEAGLLIVLVTNRDDASPNTIDHVAAFLRELKPDPALVMLSGIYAAPAPRLDALLAAFPNRSVVTPIDDVDLSAAVQWIPLRWDLYGSACIEEPIDPQQCTFTDVAGDWQRVLAPCEPDAANRPCWRLVPDPYNCTFTGSKLTLDIQRALFPPRNTSVIGQCVVRG